MKKAHLFILILSFLVFFIGVPAYAWQGRMAGMGDPYGLVVDESDFLIHPAKIANGKGVQFYGHYLFNYTDITKWDYNKNSFGSLTQTIQTDISGDELRHNGLFGASFPVGPGRMGLFFTYDGMRGDYDGPSVFSPGLNYIFDMKSVLDDFALKLLYGLPIGGFKLGGEVQIAYRQERKEPNVYDFVRAFLNDYWQYINLYMYPYKSRYWEALFKGSLDGKVGPLDLEFTMRGGFDFSGSNKWSFEFQNPMGTLTNGWDPKGGVQGWRIGGDLWLRYPLAEGRSLPFLVRVDYQDKTRDGDGPGWGTAAGANFDYKHKERNLAVTVGGGVDKVLGQDRRVAAGIYYNYIQRREDFYCNEFDLLPVPVTVMNHDTYPNSVEHQILLRLAGEQTVSPEVALRMGLNFFYGWVSPKEKHTETDTTGFYKYSGGSGSGCPHWGIGGSFGGTIKIRPVTLEPFIIGGYQRLSQKGDGKEFNTLGFSSIYDAKLTRSEWSIGGGFSIKFN